MPDDIAAVAAEGDREPDATQGGHVRRAVLGIGGGPAGAPQRHEIGVACRRLRRDHRHGRPFSGPRAGVGVSIMGNLRFVAIRHAGPWSTPLHGPAFKRSKDWGRSLWWR